MFLKIGYMYLKNRVPLTHTDESIGVYGWFSGVIDVWLLGKVIF